MAQKEVGIMKCRELAAVEGLDRDKMSMVIGGESWGEFNRDSIQDAGVGRAQLPLNIEFEEANGVKNLGQLTQFASDAFAAFGFKFPGNNAVKASVNIGFGAEVDLPPGLTKDF
jgi:hypothetical protein